MVRLETECAVHGDGTFVHGVHVQHRLVCPGSMCPHETRDREPATEAARRRGGMHADHVDLTGDVSLRVHLHPAEPVDRAVGAVQQEERGVEPRLGLPRENRVERPAALFRVLREGGVVHGQPFLLVGTRPELIEAEILLQRCGRVIEGEGTAHLQQHPPG